MSFALKKIVFSVTMACFVLAGQPPKILWRMQ